MPQSNFIVIEINVLLDTEFKEIFKDEFSLIRAVYVVKLF